MTKSILFIVLGLALTTIGLEASEAEKAIEKRIAPVGQVCVEGQDCAQEVSFVSSNPDVIRSGEEIYEAACTTCHAIGLAGAPLFWKQSHLGRESKQRFSCFSGNGN